VTITIYHNPRCSKSRQTLALIEEKGIKPDIIEYLNSPPSETELDNILTKLGKEPAELLRTGEDEFKQYFKGRDLSRAETIRLMVQYCCGQWPGQSRPSAGIRIGDFIGSFLILSG